MSSDKENKITYHFNPVVKFIFSRVVGETVHKLIIYTSKHMRPLMPSNIFLNLKDTKQEPM